MANTIDFEYEGKTYTVNKDGLLDMRIYDTMAQYGDGHPLVIHAMGVSLFGSDGCKRLEHGVADDSGAVSIVKISECVLAAVEAASAKN
jgi:hypothetical protein